MPRAPADRVLIVSSHYDEDVRWLQAQDEYEYVVYSKSRRGSPGDPRWRHLPRNVACEAEAYLAYIVDEYDRLPESVVFIHGHEDAWHQDGSVLDILRRLGGPHGLSDIRYASLNNRFATTVYSPPTTDPAGVLAELAAAGRPSAGAFPVLPDGPRAFQHLPTHAKVHAALDGSPGWRPPPYVYARHNAQFVVHRDVLRARPRERWRALLHLLYELEAVYTAKEIGILMEVLWFPLLTGEHDEWAYVAGGRHRAT